MISEKEKSYILSFIHFSILFLIISQAFFGIGSYRANTQETEDEDTVHAPVISKDIALRLYDVKVDMEYQKGVSGSRAEPGDVEYWALIIGVSIYENPDWNLDYCDDDAIDISLALIDYHGWDPSHIFLLLNSAATAQNVIDQLWVMSQTYVDSNDVFLLTFSGHGTYYTDIDPFDEADGYDEAIIFHDYALLDDDLEIALGWFVTDKIMVFLDSCHSGGFIKSTSEFGEEDLVSRSLPGTKPVELEDSFSRDLDEAGFVVLTACDDNELCVESSLLQNGVFTYYFVQGIESGFPADFNTNGYISAEEAFNYASPLTTAFNSLQHPQLYDGVTGELEFTAFAHVSINVDPNDIDFGTINKGESGTKTVTITTTGNIAAEITASLSGEDPLTFYTTNLKLDSSTVAGWSIPSLELDTPTPVILDLYIPPGTAAGFVTANLIFWAEIPPP